MNRWYLLPGIGLLVTLTGCHPDSSGPPRDGEAARQVANQQHQSHVVVIETVEVAPMKPSGESWDVAIGNYQRPDLRVTAMRRDPVLEPQLAELQRQFADLATRQNVRRADLRKQLEQANPQLGNLAATDPEALRLRQEVDAAIDRDPQVQQLQREIDAKGGEISQLKELFAPDTRAIFDVTSARYDEPTVGVSAGDTLQLSVWDLDVLSHDLVGQTEMEVTPDLLKAGKLELAFGDVRGIKISFRSTK